MLAKLIVNDEEVTFDEALELARKGEAGIPYPFMKAIVSAIQTRQGIADDMQVSVTDVVGCLRAKYIKSTEDYAEKPENMFAAFRGQLLHQLVARFAEEEAVVETRTSREFGGYTLYGTADSIVTVRANGRYKLRDFKTTKRIPQYSPWSNHVQQINLYRWLYELPTASTDLSVIYFDLNGAEVAERVLKAKDRWSDERVEEFLTQRFLPIARALDTKRRPQVHEVPSDILPWMCGYCPVFAKCLGHARMEPGAMTTLIASWGPKK